MSRLRINGVEIYYIDLGDDDELYEHEEENLPIMSQRGGVWMKVRSIASILEG